MNIFTNRRDFLKTASLASIAIGSQQITLHGRPSDQKKIFLGIDVARQRGFKHFKGKRIGLLTHPAGVDRTGRSTIDVLRSSSSVRLVALFGPEHGIYGDEKANVPVDNKIDSRTGLPVYSLYGKYRRPTPEMLAQIDAMVIDLQDIGSRSYTYVSCMRYVMEEAFKAQKEVIVLDRPNPLGGLKIEGPGLHPDWMSYVGAFRVPYVHGMTIGELALMAKKEPGVLQIPEKFRSRGKLTIIPMSGWKRSYVWPNTGLKWVPTSPAIPDFSAAVGYPMTGLGAQLGKFSHGYGSQFPFRLLLFPGISPESIAASFNKLRIPGLSFPVISFTQKKQLKRACYIQVKDYKSLNPTELSLHMMIKAIQWSDGNPFAEASQNQRSLFVKHLGDPSLLENLSKYGENTDIKKAYRDWSISNKKFYVKKQQFHIY